MANPSVGPPFVIISVHPVGGLTESGLVGIKSSPGTHENQNVWSESVLEPRFCKAML